MNDVSIFKPEDGILKQEKINTMQITSIYNYEKITSLFKNFDTMSFLKLIFDYKNLIDKGYNENFLNQSLHSMLTLPFLLLLMTGLASILTLNL